MAFLFCLLSKYDTMHKEVKEPQILGKLGSWLTTSNLGCELGPGKVTSNEYPSKRLPYNHIVPQCFATVQEQTQRALCQWPS